MKTRQDATSVHVKFLHTAPAAVKFFHTRNADLSQRGAEGGNQRMKKGMALPDGRATAYRD